MIIVRPAEKKDSKDIFEWRNDKLSRKMSHNSNHIQWADHEYWFENALNSHDHLLLICHVAQTMEKVGIVRFDIISDYALASINLSPSMRGKNLASNCLKTALSWLKVQKPDILEVKAEIKSINVGSIKAFEAADFVFDKELDRILFYTYTFKENF